MRNKHKASTNNWIVKSICAECRTCAFWYHWIMIVVLQISATLLSVSISVIFIKQTKMLPWFLFKFSVWVTNLQPSVLYSSYHSLTEFCQKASLFYFSRNTLGWPTVIIPNKDYSFRKSKLINVSFDLTPLNLSKTIFFWVSYNELLILI